MHTGKQGGIITVFARDISAQNTFILLDNSESSGLNNTTLNAMRILDGKMLIVQKESLGYTYAKDVAMRGMDYALSHFNQCKADTAHYYFNHFEMDYVGHQLMLNGQNSQGMETLRLLTVIDPGNWYPYFSYGKTLLEMGKKEEASMNLNKSSQLSPKNEEVEQVLSKLKEFK